MEIKQSSHPPLFLQIRGMLQNCLKGHRRKITLFVLIAYSLLIFLAGAVLHRRGVFGTALKPIILQNVLGPLHYIRGLLIKTERIYIDIQYKNFQKLAYARMLALANKTLYGIENEYVKAQIRYGRQIIPAKLRLKGALAKDHLQGQRWSLRVVLEGENSLFGIKSFSIMDPQRRNYMLEWLLRKLMKEEDIISKRYKFVEVVINGKNMGVYALDEHFDKTMLEFNRRREGPIIRLNQDPLYFEQATLYTGPSELDDYYSFMEISVYDTKKTLANQQLYKQFLAARDLYEGFRKGLLKTHQAFEIDKLAKWMAISDVLGAWHGFSFNNMVFYYNPVISKLEPIPDDSFNECFTDPGEKLFRLSDQANKGRFLRDIFSDLKFMEEYLKNLERVSQKAYLDGLIKELTGEIKGNCALIWRNNPYYKFPLAQLYKNQEGIRKILNPHKGIQAYFEKRLPKKMVLKIGNNKILPMEILYLRHPSGARLRPLGVKRIILAGKGYAAFVSFQEIEFNLVDELAWPETIIPELSIVYKVLGTNRLQETSIFPFPAVSQNNIRTELLAAKPNPEKFSFLKQDLVKKEIYILKGRWKIKQDLIIPSGFSLICQAKTELNLTNSAKILSYSPLVFIGSEELPIVITSADCSGQGIIVLNAEKKSVFKNVVFKNLSALNKRNWELTGALSLYRSPVVFYRCRFLNNIQGDDFLNIISSDFIVDQCVFKGSVADAIDIDFSRGRINDTTLFDCGLNDNNGDGLDISGSRIKIGNLCVDGAGDKGLSIGENSAVQLQELKIANANVAVANKDMSQLSIERAIFSNCNFGLAVFQKKAEFGPAHAKVNSLQMHSVKVPYLIEEKSTLEVQEHKVKCSRENIKHLLYPDAEKK